MKGLSGIVFEDSVVKAMIFRKPTLWPEFSTVIEISRAASESKVCKIDNNLSKIRTLAYAKADRAKG
jgi:hypothetical protein